MDGDQAWSSLPRRRGEWERFWYADNIPFRPRENLATSGALQAYRERASDLSPATCRRRFYRAAMHLRFFDPSVSAQFPSNPVVATQGLVPADWSECEASAPGLHILPAGYRASRAIPD